MSRWKIIGSPVFIPGYLHGGRHPTAAFQFGFAPLAEDMTARLDRLLEQTFGPLPDCADPSAAARSQPTRASDAAAQWLPQSLHRLQVLAATPIFERARLLAAAGGSLRCLLPSRVRDFQPAMALVEALFELVNAVLDDTPTGPLQARLKAAHDTLRTNQNPDYSWLLFAKAAAQRDIPVRELARDMIQLGVGAKSRWLDGTFTDRTSTLATKLARDKQATAQMLRRAGLPVPDHQTAASADHAAEIAAHLNYPVVVKPADLDGGRGVAAGLVDEREVREAYEACRALSSNILVERHVEGRDYRVFVFEDRALFAVERVPGGVTGDGVSTVEALVARFNAAPLRAGANAPLGKLSVDDEARLMLARQDCTSASVPAAGRFVRLRRAANIASGGVPVPVFDKAHPDNLDLAARAARALRLDLAGIDLLIPDIARSWHETGAAVCEVNARPNLGQLTTAHLYGEILDRMVDGSGRIPVAIILDAEDPTAVSSALERRLAAEGKTVGCFDSRELRIGGVPLGPGIATAFRAGQVMATDSRVEIAILCIADAGPLLTGLPFDRYDVLVLAGSHLEAKELGSRVGIAQVLPNILPACTGSVLTVGAGAAQPLPRVHAGAPHWERPASAADFPDRVWELLQREAAR